MVPKRVLVPPRPNPGPDPLREPWLDNLWLPVSILGIMMLASAGWFWWRKRRRRVRFVAGGAGVVGSEGMAVTPSASEEMLRLAVSIRGELVDRLGQVWGTKTTEELSMSVELSRIIGDEELAELVPFLDRVDQLKFAPARLTVEGEPSLDVALVKWQSLIEHLRTKLRAHAAKPRTGKVRAKVAKRASMLG